jgi:cobalamin-dependent methionine synthase I
MANDYPAALGSRVNQVANSANMLDVNMDEGMLDSEGDGHLSQSARRRA